MSLGTLRALPSRPPHCGQHQWPAEQSMIWGGAQGSWGLRYKDVCLRKKGEERQPDRGRGMALRPGRGGKEGGWGRGLGVRGSKQCGWAANHRGSTGDIALGAQGCPWPLDGAKGSRWPQAGWGGRGRKPGCGPRHRGNLNCRRLGRFGKSFWLFIFFFVKR